MDWPTSPSRPVDLQDITAALQATNLGPTAQQPDSHSPPPLQQLEAYALAGQSFGSNERPDASASTSSAGSSGAGPSGSGSAPRGRGRAGGRDKGRGEGRRGKEYRRLWEQVTKVGAGNPLEGEGRVPLSDMSVEEMVKLVHSLPPEKSVVPAVQQALHYLDSRALAALLKELAKVGCSYRAVELFDWLRALDPQQELSNLCDVYTYTTVISICGQQQQLRRALELVAELKSRGIQCNVHTYSSLMNVCIKCGELDLALDVYKQMRAEGCKPNVVTYNTLIDVYGKTGQWEKAVQVLDVMHEEGLEPEVRTYNTAIIACNMCGQPLEALKVYDRLLAADLAPISTTYTALISAYSKAGQLDKALETFGEMVRAGCERSVITYSSLIAACEKAGRWELALDLFAQMPRDGVVPNTVTFNSLITACSQGAQWEKAAEVFDQMRTQNCKPDVVTYTALIGAYERGGQWQRALRAFEAMQAQGCKPDAIVYHTVIDMLWNTGIVWAQARALQLYNSATRNFQFRLTVQSLAAADNRLEVLVPMLSVGVAVLAILKWLMDLRSQLEKEGPGALREAVVLTLGRSRHHRDQGNPSVRDTIIAMLRAFNTPFQFLPAEVSGAAGPHSLECASWQLREWLIGPDFVRTVGCLTADLRPLPGGPGSAVGQGPEGSRRKMPAQYMDPGLSAEVAVERRCAEGFAAVQRFEGPHAFNFSSMDPGYISARRGFLESAFSLGSAFFLTEETVYDAVLLMDRVMANGLSLNKNLGVLFVAAATLVAARQGEPADKVPMDTQLDAAIGFPDGSVRKMESNMRLVLNGDTSSISSLRCLKLYFERLGYELKDGLPLPNAASSALPLLRSTLFSPAFLNFRPSVVAAAVLHCDRRMRGLLPFWPTAIAHLTGMHDLGRSPDFLAAARATETMLVQQAPAAAATLAGLPQNFGVPWMGPGMGGMPGMPGLQGLGAMQGLPPGLQQMLPPGFPQMPPGL